MSETTHSSEDIQKIAELIKGIDFGMLTTIDEAGHLHSRPMSTNGEVEFNGDLWFFTSSTSHKVYEIERKPQVNVSFASPKDQNYVSLSGTAELVLDKEKMAELWQPQLKAWFPQELDTPDIALLKVNVETAEYWDAPSSFVAHAIGLVKATVTGQRAPQGENKTVALA